MKPASPFPSRAAGRPRRTSLSAAAVAALGLAAPFASRAAPHGALIPNTAHRTPNTGPAELPLARRIVSTSARYLGTPYRRDPLGEGPSGRVDRDPLICTACVDCQTFVEQVLAEALAPRPEEVLPLLNRIRYRDGVIGFGTRNHFMVSDWLPHNRWLIRDLTGPVGGRAARPMAKVIDRAAFFRSRGAPELGRGVAPEPSRTLYIPRAALPAVAPKIPNAAVLIWVQDRPGIIAAHCGFAVRRPDGALLFRHASERRGRVLDVPLLSFARRAPARLVGLKVCQAVAPLDKGHRPR